MLGNELRPEEASSEDRLRQPRRWGATIACMKTKADLEPRATLLVFRI
jgi:hypothetical protein